MGTNSETVFLQLEGGVAHLVLNRPEEGNTFTARLLEELAAATRRLATEPGLRAVVLRGEGPNFCYGASVDMFLKTPAAERPKLIRHLVSDFHLAVSGLQRLPVPVLGVAHGMTIGGGVALMAACDVVLATDETKFRLAWSGIGITMDGGSTYLLPRVIGTHRTLELIYTNRIFDAAEAKAWGFANWVVPEAERQTKTAELAKQLAASATGALGACKRLVMEGGANSFETHLENEAVALVHAFGTRDSDEGFAAFREKRRPKFTGE